MEIKDIRIGNIMRFGDVVKGIGSDGSISLNNAVTGNSVIPMSMLQPMHLNKSVLEKWGFVQEGDTIELSKTIFITTFELIENGDGFTVIVKQKESEIEDAIILHEDYKSLHELQNLVFAITGRELKKEPQQ